MNSRTYAILHSSILLLILLSPRIVQGLQNKNTSSVTSLLGSGAIEVVLIIFVELIIVGLTISTRARIGRVIRAIWGLLLTPIALLAYVDIAISETLGSQLDLSTLYFVMIHLNTLSFIEVNALIWAFVISSILTGAVVGIIGWRATTQNESPIRKTGFVFRLTLTAAVFLLVLLVYVAGITCFAGKKTNSVSQNNTFILARIATLYRVCNQGQAKKTMSASTVSALSKFAQSPENLTLTYTLPPQPVELQATENSTLDNIVIINLESTRADATTPYNPELDTTPFLNAIAQQGLFVKNGYVNYAYTSKGLVAISCGIPPNSRLANTESGSGGIPTSCLPDLLKPFGYASAFFQSATQTFENRGGLVKNAGFDTFVPLEKLDPASFQTVNYFGLEERSMIQPIMQWVDNQNGPFLLSVLTLSSHHPYQPPSSFAKKRYEGEEVWSDYLNSIRYVDIFLADLFQEFESRGLLENTLFIFTGDHGVSFDGRDHLRPWQENIHVPLILWSKHLIPEPATVDGLRQHTDIIPTSTDLLNLEVTQGNFYGTSLLQPVDDRTIYFKCKLSICSGLINDRFKFVLYDRSFPPTLHDIIEDPNDENDLLWALPDNVVTKYINQLKDWDKRVREIYQAK